MIKKHLFCLLVMMTFMPDYSMNYDSSFGAPPSVDGIYYRFDDTTKTAMVTYYSWYGEIDEEMYYRGTVNIPATVSYNGVTYDVTQIGKSAFSSCAELTSVTIPLSVTNIGDYAFLGCSGLTSFTLPSSVTSIGNYVFAGCAGLTSFTIPSSVTTIGESAFAHCSGLTSVSIPSSMTSIGKFAFEGCSSLPSVTMPSSVTSLEEYTFSKCSSLSSVTIPSSVTSIGGYAFWDCIGLTSITIPSSVTNLGSSAFMGCTGLTSFTIPASVTSIGSSIFYGCAGLTSIEVEDGNTVYDSRDHCNAIIVTETDELIFGLSNSFIPDGVKSIRGNAYAFIGGAYTGNTGLTDISIPASVTHIGSYAFYNCCDLNSVTIGGSAVTIEVDAFRGCTALRTVRSYIKEPNGISKFEEDTYRQGTLYVPFGTKELYARFDGWREFLHIEEMEAGATPSPNGACATPAIVFADGKFKFQCKTPGARFTSSLTMEEETFEGDEVTMGSGEVTYILTVYANAPGYDQSEPATYRYNVNKSDVNQDGAVNVADISAIISTMASKGREF